MSYLIDLLIRWNVSEQTADWLARSIASAVTLLLACAAYPVFRSFLLRIIKRLVEHSKTRWDDFLLQRKVFNRIAYLAPALVVYYMIPVILEHHEAMGSSLRFAVQVYMVLVGLIVVDGLLNALLDIYRTFDFSKRLPIKSFIQFIKIILYCTVGVSVLAIALGKDPLAFLGGLGAMTAVLLLIFKDSILGLVAGIQLAANKFIRIGDWIEMPRYGADGDVIDITLTTVKVRNWDKTISTIPTYSLISDSFKNWRGMSESGGRRIKRSISIDMNSIMFCTEEMLQRFSKFQHIKEYIERKRKEVAEHNADHKVDMSELINGRHLTNIGTFRAYVVAYLRNHLKIHQEMTFLVRHLKPTSQGLPIEIYVFSNEQAWVGYEAIQADIFDHILAVVEHFDLRVFQEPSGADIRALSLGAS